MAQMSEHDKPSYYNIVNEDGMILNTVSKSKVNKAINELKAKYPTETFKAELTGEGAK